MTFRKISNMKEKILSIKSIVNMMLKYARFYKQKQRKLQKFKKNNNNSKKLNTILERFVQTSAII